MTQIGNRLRLARVQAGMTLREAEEETGLSKDTISRLERSLRNPQPLTAAKLAEAYGRSVEEFLEAPKAQALLPPDSGEERGRYPYPWMGDALAHLIDGWEQSLEEVEVDGRYAHAVAIAAMDTYGAVLLLDQPGGTRGVRVPENEVDERKRVAKRLYGLSGRAIDRYRASEVFETDEERRLTEQRGRLRLAS